MGSTAARTDESSFAGTDGPAVEPGAEPAPRVCLIGAGVIARHHAAAAERLGGSSRVSLAVADPNPDARQAFRAQFPEARLFADAATMLAEPPSPEDIVVVATPPFAHRELTLAALATGRHVLCEKPLAMDRAEALEMLRSARARNRLLGCCSTRFLGLAATEEAKRAVAGGTLGDLYHATFVNRGQRGRPGIEYQPSSRWFLDRSLSGGGTLMDWAPYDFTTLNHVLEPVRVDVLSAWMASPETALDLSPGTVFDTEQHAGASLRYHRRDGQVLDVTFERAACTHGPERVLVEVEGTRGAVTWDWLGDGGVTITRDRDGKPASETPSPRVGSPLSPHHRPLVYFAERILGRESLAVVDEQAVFNFSCIRAIYDSVRSGQPQSVHLQAEA